MQRNILMRTIVTTVIFTIVFIALNHFNSSVPLSALIIQGLIAGGVFGLLYFTLFTVLQNPERKYIFGISLPIGILIGILTGYALFQNVRTGVVIGIVIGVAIGLVWTYIKRRKQGDVK